MGMETMHLIQTPHTTDLLSLSDTDLEAYFASAGLIAEVVTRCDTPRCRACPTDVVERAA